ncbi:proton-conducting transporter membrane subunit [Opitutus terrae]|uniref:NADH dehydrogenase (Quinone) n=1 Tax=Opitutus terrae (strain DSM 11246 / JCM 15787 / PB90-1) TaxID=452637 RepID=B1ZSF1_OPITP|nr:proton-conducting transporter membrane subunit [Opitutus terrae]ACB75745.1 NADH dehydrogenase (quinone) [Opitutus terrae PB90-1]
MLLTALICIPFLIGLAGLVARPRAVLEAGNVAGFVAVLAGGIELLRRVLVAPGGAVTEWGGFLRADALSVWMVLLIAIVSLATSVYAVGYFRRDLAEGAVNEHRFREFYVLTPLFATGMLVVVLANNLGVMWVAVEGTALASVLLVALYNRKTSLEAAWKYVMLGGVGLVLALFGTIFTYAAAIDKTGGAVMPSFNWSSLLAIAPQLDPSLVTLAFIFVLVGYGTKAGLAPMHPWLPDAHSEAPSPTSAMLSGVSLKIAVYALLRFHILTTACLGTQFSGRMLLGFGLGSMLLAGPFILVQKNLKRMLAYSSLEHVGLICVAIGLNAPLAVFGALLHMGYHALTKPVLFFAAGNIHQHCHTLDFRRLGGGLGRNMPVTAVVLGVGAVAVCGLPPFGLFVSELTIIAGGFGAQQLWVSVIVVVSLTVVFCGVLSRLSRLLLGPAVAGRPTEPVSPGRLAVIGLPLVALLVFTVWLPEPVFEVMNRAAAIIGGAP